MKNIDKKKVEKKLLEYSEKEGECLIWKMSINSDGYGNTWAFGKSWRAHRLSYFIFKGKIPKDKSVCHSCGNRACIKPDHLCLRTHYRYIGNEKS